MWWVLLLVLLLIGATIYSFPFVSRKVLYWQLKQKGFDLAQILSSPATVDNTELLERMASRLELILRRLERLENSLAYIQEQLSNQENDEEDEVDIMTAMVKRETEPIEKVNLRKLAHGVIDDIREKREIRPNHWDLSFIADFDPEQLLLCLTQIESTIDVVFEDVLEDPFFFSNVESKMSTWNTELANAAVITLEGACKTGSYRENMTKSLKQYVQGTGLKDNQKASLASFVDMATCLLPEKPADGTTERMVTMLGGLMTDPVGMLTSSLVWFNHRKYLSSTENISTLLRSPEMIADIRGKLKPQHIQLYKDESGDQELVEALIAGKPMDFDRPEVQPYIRILDKVVREDPKKIRGFLDVAFRFYLMGYGRTRVIVGDKELNEENFEQCLRAAIVRGGSGELMESLKKMLQN